VKVSVQLIVHPDDDAAAAPMVREVFSLDRDGLTPDTLGLQLAEAQDLLVAVQDTVITHQVRDAVAAQVPCPYCGRPRRHKDTRAIVVRSLFGALRLPSPRWWHCPCRDQPTRTFQPLAAVLPERTTPELAYLQARFAGLVSYGITAKLLGELLPLGRRLHPAVVRRQTQAVAARLEGELGEEQFSFIDTCQRDRDELPRPDLPLTVGLDGGYVHSSTQRTRRDGWFEVLKAHGMQDKEFPNAGADAITEIGRNLELLKWFLWHGNVFRALQTVEDLTVALDAVPHGPEQAKLGKAVGEFDTYLRANAERIPNYGERRRAGEAISTAFTESTVNQVISKRMVKKQQMRWTPQGAHLLLQVRCRVLNEQLADDFHRWYPAFTRAPETAALAA